MKDQYNNPVPADLTLLDVPVAEYDKKTLDRICRELKWYKNRLSLSCGYIFVSASELEKILDGLIDETSPEDCGITETEWLVIDDVLKRYNPEDNFYHA